MLWKQAIPYNNEVASSVVMEAKRLQVQMNSQNFDLFFQISMINILPACKLELNTNGVLEESALWLFLFYDASRSSQRWAPALP